MPSEVPDGWSSVRMGDLGSTYNGLSGKTKADFGEGRPFVTYRQVYNGGHIDLDGCDYVAVGPDENQNAVMQGDVLFTTSSETPEEVAFSAVMSTGFPELYLNSFCFGFRPEPDGELDTSFATYFFRGPDFRAEAFRLGQGSTRFNISKTKLMEVSLPLPPLPEQKKIAAILSSVDEAMQATQAVIEQTRRVKEGLLQDLLTRGLPGHTRFKQTEIGEIPESWGVLGLFDVADLQHGKSFPSSDYGDSGVHLVRPGNLHVDNIVMWDEAHTTSLPEHHWDESPGHRVGEGELLMNLTAQSLADNFLGRVCMTPADTRCLLNQRIGRLTARGQVSTEYLFWCLQGPQFREHIRTRGQGSKVQHLYNRDLETARLPIPGLREQEAISQRLWDARAAVERQVELLGSQQSVKAGLLQDLLTGKVRVSA